MKFLIYVGPQDISGRRKGDVSLEGALFETWQKGLLPHFMENIERNVRTSFYLRLVSFVKLRNMQDNTEIVLYSNTSSPWFNQTDEAKNVCNDRKSFVWTLPILKDQALNGCLLFFSMLTSRLFWTGSRCWEQAPCKIGCGILPTLDR